MPALRRLKISVREEADSDISFWAPVEFRALRKICRIDVKRRIKWPAKRESPAGNSFQREHRRRRFLAFLFRNFPARCSAKSARGARWFRIPLQWAMGRTGKIRVSRIF